MIIQPLSKSRSNGIYIIVVSLSVLLDYIVFIVENKQISPLSGQCHLNSVASGGAAFIVVRI